MVEQATGCSLGGMKVTAAIESGLLRLTLVYKHFSVQAVLAFVFLTDVPSSMSRGNFLSD